MGIDISGDPRLSDLTEVLDKINDLRREGMKFAIHLAEVPNHEETKAVLATNPDRIGEIIAMTLESSMICLKVMEHAYTLHLVGQRSSGSSLSW